MLDVIRQLHLISKLQHNNAMQSKAIKDAERQNMLLDDTSAASSLRFKSSKEQEIVVPDILDSAKLLFLATLGGAQALGIDDVVGSFESGKQFDAILVEAATPSFDIFDSNEFWQIFEKFLYSGDDRNIEAVYVAGKQVL
eukprot:TRINITY_DN15351_c0_g1_i1.p3 TRINITY_DN15351_c0_g1~~TRINITY_DN15351_c0_g1_i1.p3  ORF type:complete len:140 (+),score=60.83 TRINITY_DN15351_c0_g1_i1:295-714(+)